MSTSLSKRIDDLSEIYIKKCRDKNCKSECESESESEWEFKKLKHNKHSCNCKGCRKNR